MMSDFSDNQYKFSDTGNFGTITIASSPIVRGDVKIKCTINALLKTGTNEKAKEIEVLATVDVNSSFYNRDSATITLSYEGQKLVMNLGALENTVDALLKSY